MRIFNTGTLKLGGGLLALTLITAVNAFAQAQTDQQRAEQQALRALHARDIPAASLSSTTDEAKWWEEVRAAGKAIGPSRGAKKQKDELIRLIKEGSEKSYRIPVADRAATLLWRSPPDYTEDARNRRVKGSVGMAVELKADGSVGEIKIVQGLDPGLDQMAVTAVRKLVFLPMVKDRKFVATWMPMTMSFDIY